MDGGGTFGARALSTAPVSHCARVLVVDDEVDIREPLVELFEGEGYEVFAAANGLEALGEARRNRPDVILLDWMMPVMNGREFRLEQARDPLLADVPVVAISASSTDASACASLQKPFHLEEILELVRQLTARA